MDKNRSDLDAIESLAHSDFIWCRTSQGEYFDDKSKVLIDIADLCLEENELNIETIAVASSGQIVSGIHPSEIFKVRPGPDGNKELIRIWKHNAPKISPRTEGDSTSGCSINAL